MRLASLLMATVFFPFALSCGGEASESKDDPSSGWLSIGREVFDEIEAAFVSGDINACFAECIFDAPDPAQDLYGSSANDVVDSYCERASQVLVDLPESNRQLIRACDSVREVLNLTIDSVPMSPSNARSFFDRADEALVAAGATTEAVPEEMRAGVLATLVEPIFRPYLDGKARELDAPKTRTRLRYLCPSMPPSGDASIARCRELMDELSHPLDDHLDYASPKEVEGPIQRMFTALSP